MASRAIELGRASAFPLNLIAQALPKLTRHELEAVTERLIEYLDTLDPDPDDEPNGDELDGTAGEDDFYPHCYQWKAEPGCPISDPDCAIDDQPCDDPFQDMEPEETAIPIFGVDQTRWIIGPNGGPSFR